AARASPASMRENVDLVTPHSQTDVQPTRTCLATISLAVILDYDNRYSRRLAGEAALERGRSEERVPMRISDMNWMQVEAYLGTDDRCVLPLGSVEQHGYLSLAVDQILAARVAVEAAEPLGVPVFPTLPYGLAPYFAAYP